MSQFKTPPENDKANAKEKKGDVGRGKRGGTLESRLAS